MITKIAKFVIRKGKPKIKGFSPKYSGIKKFPAQKSPKVVRDPINASTEDFINRMGDKPEFMGFSNIAASRVAAESVASRVSIRSFDRTLKSALKESRKITAEGIRGKRFKIKQPTKPSLAQQRFGVTKGSGLPRSKPSLKSAKNKGAVKAYNTADVKAEKSFQGVLERYTSRNKISSFKNRTSPTKSPMDFNEKAAYRDTKSGWGFDPDKGPDFNGDIMSGSNRKLKTSFAKGKGPFSSLNNKRYEWKKKK